MYQYLNKNNATYIIVLVILLVLLMINVYFNNTSEGIFYFYTEVATTVFLSIIIIFYADKYFLKFSLNSKEQFLQNNLSPCNYIFFDSNKGKLIVPQPTIDSLGLRRKREYNLSDLQKIFSEQDWQEISYILKNADFASEHEHTGGVKVVDVNKVEKYFKYSLQYIHEQKRGIQGFAFWFIDFTSSHSHEEQIVSLIKKYRLMSFELDYLFNHLPIGLWRREGNGELVFSNTNFKKIANSFVDKKGHNELESGLRRLAELSYIDKSPTKIIRSVAINNQIKSYEFTELPISTISGSVGYAVDVTSQEELAKNHLSLTKTLEQIMELSNQAILILDNKLDVLQYNLSVTQLFELDRLWMTSKPNFSDFWDKLKELNKLPDFKDYRKFKSDLINSIRQLKDPIDDFLHLPDGRTIKISLIPSGKNTTVMFDNISDVLSVERMYNEVANVHKTVLQNFPQPILIFGQDGKLKLFNNQFSDNFNIEAESLKSNPRIDDLLGMMKTSKKAASELKSQIVNCIETRKSSQIGIAISKSKKVLSSTMSLPDNTVLVVLQS